MNFNNLTVLVLIEDLHVEKNSMLLRIIKEEECYIYEH